MSEGVGEGDGQEALSLPGLVRAEARKAPAPRATEVRPAATLPVARVLVDVPLAHLDRPFDYQVTVDQDASAVPGARVKVRFAGKEADGFVLERAQATDHQGRLQPLRRVVSAEPVLTPEVAELTGLLARRYAGTRSDVLRLAVPPRHATVEKRAPATPAAPPPAIAPDWSRYAGATSGPEALRRWGDPADGGARIVLTVLPGEDWTEPLADAVGTAAAAGRGVLVCVPDQRDVARLDATLVRRLGAGRHVTLTADLGPAKRYAAFLAVARGTCRVVIGTRAAAFAPVHDLGLVAMWDDGDDSYVEPRAPYCHTREVLLTRAEQTGAGALLAGWSRSVEAQYLVRTGWAGELAGGRAAVRERARVEVVGAADAAYSREPSARASRVPHEAFRLIRECLHEGPVLVQTPRAGYATRLACDRCREPARCAACGGPLRVTGAGAAPSCAWCGTVASLWICPECGGHGLRAPVLGEERTAEELGRGFPGVRVRRSSAGQLQDSVPAGPALVVATPGAEPHAEGGYAGVVLLDTWLMLARAGMRTEEEALRRWCGAAAMVRPGGRVLAVGDPAHPALQALVRWDPGGFATREMEQRRLVHLPPASRLALLRGGAGDVEAFLAALERPPGTEVLGPLPAAEEGEEAVRYVVRVPRAGGPALSGALRDVQAARSTRKLPHVRVVVDPHDLG